MHHHRALHKTQHHVVCCCQPEPGGLGPCTWGITDNVQYKHAHACAYAGNAEQHMTGIPLTREQPHASQDIYTQAHQRFSLHFPQHTHTGTCQTTQMQSSVMCRAETRPQPLCKPSVQRQCSIEKANGRTLTHSFSCVNLSCFEAIVGPSPCCYFAWLALLLTAMLLPQCRAETLCVCFSMAEAARSPRPPRLPLMKPELLAAAGLIGAPAK